MLVHIQCVKKIYTNRGRTLIHKLLKNRFTNPIDNYTYYRPIYVMFIYFIQHLVKGVYTCIHTFVVMSRCVDVCHV